MSESDFHMYCLSNGSELLFSDNSLTKFKAKLPNRLEWKKNDLYKWCVAVEAIGFDPNFTTEFFNESQHIPSVVFIDYEAEIKESEKFGMRTDFKDFSEGRKLIHFDHSLRHIFLNGNFVYYFQKKPLYSLQSYHEFFNEIPKIVPVTITYNVDDFTFTIRSDYYKQLSMMIHENVEKNLKISYLPHVYASSSKQIEKRVHIIDNEKYISYFLAADHVLQIDIKSAAVINIPNVVKIKSNIVRDQVYNSEHAKDLACFTPKLTPDKRYCFYEAERKNYLQLNNTILDVVDFELTDGLNRRLCIHEGTPTIVKLNLRKMDANKKSFHIRLSSDKSIEFPNNTLSQFSVRLPKTYYFNRFWKVALASILLPGKHCTFPFTDEVSFTYKEGTENKVFKLNIPHKELTKDEILELLTKFFNVQPKFGQVRIQMVENELEPLVEFTFFREGIFKAPEHFCKVLGYGGSDFKNGYKKFNIKFASGRSNFKLKFSYGINIHYYRPNYIMSYTNIVEPTPINAELTNVLKVFQVTFNKDHALYEFKHLEHHRLLNDEINVIHIDLRNHAGELVQFEKTENSQVIVNLLFTNYTD